MVTPASDQDGPSAEPHSLLVGIGASAGGLEALERFFSNMPDRPGFAVVVVQHLDPDHESLMAELLSKSSPIPVEKAEDGMKARPDHAYVIPPNAILTVEKGALRVTKPAAPRGQRSPIDVFFRSLAEDQGESAVGIVLSGTGSDGTLGLRAIKENGGLTLAQSAETAKYSSMPQSAVMSGSVDLSLPVEQMPQKLQEYSRHLARPEHAALPEEAAEAVERIRVMLRERGGHDFGHYKRATLERRIQRRAHIRQAGSLFDYVEFLRREPAEIDALVKDLLIGVTQPFRDPEAFAELERAVIPKLLERAAGEPLRVWVAGCATGEEAYSIAILLKEGMEAAKKVFPVQIFATDVDEASLEVGRRAIYPQGLADHVTPARLERFFTRVESSFQVVKELREMCIFSVHDLVRDPPFSRIDLLSCRNVLIYFESSVQKKLLPVLRYALRPDGYLFLGPSEHVAGHSDLFRPLDKRHRIFQRRESAVHQFLEFPLGTGTPRAARPGEPGRPATGRGNAAEVFQRVLLQDFSPGAALITDQGAILHVSGRTSAVLELAHGPFENDIFTMARSDLRLELRSAVHKAARSGEAITIERIPLGGEGPPSSVRLTVRPLPTPVGDPRLLMVVFDVRAEPEARRAPAGDGGAGAATYVEDLEAELRRTKEDLQSTIEELETSNEELKSSNEELLSMNEELQSANEELQTSKEELQSVNEELQTVNAELQKKVEEVNRSHDDLENLFQSTRIATMFLDHDLRVKRFTPATAEIFRLIESDLGRPITDISAPFEDRAWIADVHEVLRNLAPKERLLHGPDGGSWHMLRVLPYRTRANVIEGAVATFIDVTELKRLEARASLLAAIVDSSSDAILGSTLDGTITSWNRGAELLFGYSAEEAIGLSRSFLIPPDRCGDIEDVKRRLATGEGGEPIETVRLRKDGRPVPVSLGISPILDEAGKLAGYSVIARDITARKAAEAENARLTRALERVVEQLRTLLDVAPIGLAVAAEPDCRVIQGNKAAAAMFGVAPDVNISKSAEGAEDLPFRVLRAGKEVAAEDLAMQRAAASGQAVAGEEYEVVLRDGRRRSIVVSAVPLRGERGEPGGAVAAFIDVTEERQRQSELQSASRNKDEFLALLGHELRNPLGAIAMAVKLLERKRGDGQNRPLDIVSRQVRHLTRLVDDILDVARVSHGKIRLEAEPVELAALLAQVVDDHREPARTHDVELELRRDGHDVWVRGDRVRLVQVFGNLLSNAIKFTSAHGRVTLKLRADGGMAIVDVADSGIGMAPALFARLFQPFEQGSWGLDRSQGGLGLGLALARSLVDLHGGTLVADSAGAGRGSTFTVRLPNATAPEQPSESSPAPRAEPARILVIEDNQDGAEALAEVLRLEGHEVEVAHDGASGIEAARGSPPDLIVCDIGLPGKLDGYAVARILREDPALRSTCLVALTGYARESDIEQARGAGFDAHLAKPPSVERLRALIAGRRRRPGPLGPLLTT